MSDVVGAASFCVLLRRYDYLLLLSRGRNRKGLLLLPLPPCLGNILQAGHE